tara:strand:- start:711 stop:1022 length:312 start_codon:yes stop_codon:yes gene_type:complete
MTKHSKYYYDFDRNMPYKETNIDLSKYKGLTEHLDQVDKIKTTATKYDKVITIKVDQDTYDAWELLKENWGDVIGYDNDSKIFEFAIIEALNIPISSLGGFNF